MRCEEFLIFWNIVVGLLFLVRCFGKDIFVF